MTTNYTIYVLQLENNKWFLHITQEKKHENVIYEALTLYDFVKSNPPIQIYESFKTSDYFEINTLTKKYMTWIGIENVRGGIYSDEILPDYLLKSLELEINFVVEEKINKSTIFNFVSNKENVTIEDYQNRVNSYNNLVSKGYNIITRDIITDIEWLQNKIENFENNLKNRFYGIVKVEQQTNERYKKVLHSLELINNYYYKLDEDLIKVEETIYIKYPKFTLDNFIYHYNLNRNWDTEKEVALDILRKYEYMGYTLINKIDCLEFDFYNVH
jgi:hypothetical protein